MGDSIGIWITVALTLVLVIIAVITVPRGRWELSQSAVKPERWALTWRGRRPATVKALFNFEGAPLVVLDEADAETPRTLPRDASLVFELSVLVPGTHLVVEWTQNVLGFERRRTWSGPVY